MQSHYVSSALPELVDALIHIDQTDALIPLDMTNEWKRGRVQAHEQHHARIP